MTANDYTAGRWVAGVGWMAARPVAKITRKHPTRHGDEVKRATTPYGTRAEARAAAQAWAERMNGEISASPIDTGDNGSA